MEEQKKRIKYTIQDFDVLRAKNCYYVDKTGLIKELVTEGQTVTLITRPRRFGKTLNMSMLANFFSMEGDKHIFDGLEISREKAFCKEHMGKYPVVFITMKDIEGNNYNEAERAIADLIIETASQFRFLNDSEKLDKDEKKRYEKMLNDEMDINTICSSLKLLCQYLQKHYEKKVILLIDEYDVPLNKAYLSGYYDNMISLIRRMFAVLKTKNSPVEFAVLTGCLRVSKESIFSGLNNLAVESIDGTLYAEYFGFTDEEVRTMLDYYGFSDRYDSIKEWYDGYQFGKSKIYCPWDVLKYCEELQRNPDTQPQKYWANTSGNEAIKQFISIADDPTREEFEKLLAGETLEKNINENLTYQDMYKNANNLWSLFYATGYLTQCGETKDGKHRLVIPNKEVYNIFKDQIEEYFDEYVKADTEMLNAFYTALKDGDAETVETIYTQYLEEHISVNDYAATKATRENFYHALMLGVLMANRSWKTVSNREAGIGYADILMQSKDKETGIIIEIKYAEEEQMEKVCQNALKQINDRRYEDAFRRTKVKTIRKYAIACSKKSCRVMLGE